MALALAATSASAGKAVAGNLPAAAVSVEKAQHWSASSGTVGVRWNRELARDIGLVLRGQRPAAATRSRAGMNTEVFNLRQAGSLEFDVRNGNLRGFIGGVLQAAGGHLIDTAGGPIDLTDFHLIPRRGDDSAPRARPRQRRRQGLVLCRPLGQ